MSRFQQKKSNMI